MSAELLFPALVVLMLAVAGGWWAWGRPLAAARTALAERGAQLQQALAELAHYKDRFEAAEAARRDEEATARSLEAQVARFEATEAERARAHAAQLQQLQGEFQRLASEALERAQRHFAETAAETLKVHRAEAEKGLDASRVALGDLIRPMRETLGRYETELKTIEAKREQAYGGIAEQLAAVAQGQAAVKLEAGRIVAALRSSARASGAWGEAQLRNVLEMGGLRDGIDFALQASVSDDEGQRRRPDAVLRLPGDRQLVIDSKCSLDDYLSAGEAATDADRQSALKRHAAAVRQHARGLSEKAYWKEFAQSADFVIMFLPGENFLSAALEHDLGLLEWALGQRILLAGPTNLLAIARVVAMVWRQEKMAEEAQRIGELGADLYGSLATMAEHVNRVGRNLGDATGAFNDFVGSLEGRVLAKARRFTELGVERGKKPLPEVAAVEKPLRLVQAAELTRRDGSD